MNGNRSFGNTLPDDLYGGVMKDFNAWWLKWKHQQMDDRLFEEAWKELDMIMECGRNYPMIRNLGVTFLYELEARSGNGYTETARDKLLSLIRNDGKDTGVRYVS